MAYFSVKLDLSGMSKWERKKLDAFIKGYPFTRYDSIWWKEVLVFPEYFCEARWNSKGVGSEKEVIKVIKQFLENAGSNFASLSAEAYVEFEGNPKIKVDKSGNTKISLQNGSVTQVYEFKQ